MPEIPWTASPDDFDDMWDDKQDLGVPQYVPDMLCTMFAQQLAHMQAYAAQEEDADDSAFLPPEQWGTLVRFRTQAALRENAGYIIEELMEAVGLLKNKPWRQLASPMPEAEFREELADVWHFFIQFHILAGINPLEVFQEYFRKSLINENRRENGY